MDTHLMQQADRLRLQLISGGRAVVDATWNGRIAAPMFSRLYYIAGGVAFITVAGERIPLESGYWYLLPTGCPFDYECIEQMDHIYFHLKLCDYDEVDLLAACGEPRRIRCPHEEIVSLLSGDEALRLRHAVEGVVLAMLAEHGVAVTGEDYSSCVFAALQYIKRHLSVQLSVAEIAEAAAVSVSTLTKQFKKELSMSVGEYVDALVLSAAERRVKHGSEPLREISEQLGFSDQFYFSKRFKQTFGVSPREYRRRKSL